MATCKGCGAQIEWVKTQNGLKTPVNSEYIDVLPGVGDVKVVTDDGRVITGRQVKDEGSLFPIDGKVMGRVSHFATCSKAGRFRRR